MRAVIFDVEGTVNVGAVNARRRGEAALEALHRAGFRVTLETFNESLQYMRQAATELPHEAALWQLFRPLALERGWDQRKRATEWQALLTQYHGLVGYRFEEREGVRQLLEELRFDTVDTAGDVPLLFAVSDSGEFVRDSLEQARLAPLFDAIRLTTAYSMRAGDPRFLVELVGGFNMAYTNCLVIGPRVPAFLAPAAALGMATLRFFGEADSGMPARGPWEEPDYEVANFAALCDHIVDWVNTPVRVRR